MSAQVLGWSLTVSQLFLTLAMGVPRSYAAGTPSPGPRVGPRYHL